MRSISKFITLSFWSASSKIATICLMIVMTNGCVTSVNRVYQEDSTTPFKAILSKPRLVKTHFSYLGSGFYSVPDRRVEAPSDQKALVETCNKISEKSGLGYKFIAISDLSDADLEADVSISEIKHEASLPRWLWMVGTVVTIGLIPYWDDISLEVTIELVDSRSLKKSIAKKVMTRREYIALYPLPGDDHKSILSAPLFSHQQVPELAQILTESLNDSRL